jgi:chorismate lyase/3-hydroxybenzoate synthase
MHRSLADDASTPIHEATLTSSTRQLTRKFSFPSWIDQWAGQDSITSQTDLDTFHFTRTVAGNRAVLIAETCDAASLSDHAFTRATRRIYELLAAESRRLRLAHPVRFWNWIPQIHRPTVDGDRYMSFNLGRYEAMHNWFGDDLAARVPAASGVGSFDGTLCVGVLLAESPGRQIENPRQIPAYQYSSRFGRLPPCFARATRWRDQLFIAGTASVVGEESQHPSEFDRQLQVTLEHLELMLNLGFNDEGKGTFASFRVYLPDQQDRPARVQLVLSALTDLADAPIEIVCADLCRSNLLVEIEAVGRLSSENS